MEVIAQINTGVPLFWTTLYETTKPDFFLFRFCYWIFCGSCYWS